MSKNEKYHKLKAEKESEVYISREGYKIEILDYISNLNCTVRIDSKLILYNVNYHQIKKGEVKNPFHKSVYGVACLGVGKYTKHIKRRPTICYDTWIGMLRRVYGKNLKRPTYKNVSVCEEWLNFQNFADWFHLNYDESYMKGWHLDKDLLSSEVKIYSPETCCFLPPHLNTIVSKKIKSNSCVTRSGKFEAILSIGGKSSYIGIFNTKEEADICTHNKFKDQLLTMIVGLPDHVQKAFIKKYVENEY